MMLAGMLFAALALQAGKAPPAKAGTGDVTFEKSGPLCDADEIKARFRAKEDAGPYDVRKEKFKLIVPKSYAPSAKWGLFVYVNAGDDPGIPAEYEPVLEKHKLIAVAAYKSGNGRNIFDRFRMAIDAAVNLQARFSVDPKRVYVSGFSGGGRVASMLSIAYADLFTGGIPFCGVNFYLDIPSEGDRMWPRDFIPVDEAVAIAKATGRFALVTGEKDMNLKNTRAVFEHGYKAEGFKHATVLEVPGMSHATPPAEWFDKGLNFLDNPK
jgi:dienelactone hydrolase